MSNSESDFITNGAKINKHKIKKMLLSDDEDFSDKKEVKKENFSMNEVQTCTKKRKKSANGDSKLGENKKPKIEKEVKIKKEPKIKEEEIEEKTPNKNIKKDPNGEEKKRRKKKTDDEVEVWKWWEEAPLEDGVHWNTLQHNGPYFEPPYTPLPSDVEFYYNGKPFKLSIKSEEIATFYAKMLDSDYTKNDDFNENFFNDWVDNMEPGEKKTITSLTKCDFTKIFEYFQQKREEKKALTKEEKQVIKENNEKITKRHGFCLVDGHEQKVGNFRIEPPGLFRGRGEHPKKGKIKKRVQPEDVTINISEGSKVPDPPEGHTWKAIVHDNKVTWLAHWVENVLNHNKYVMLNPTAKIKGLKDMAKYDVARGLRNCIEEIRRKYLEDMTSKETRIRQRAVALYFIDRLALRAGHEKDQSEAADTVGCCSLKVKHIKLMKDTAKKEYIVEFDFLGKDSVRYFRTVPVEKQVYKNLVMFTKDKNENDDLFDKLSTGSLNKYLTELMPGLTAKVFRTYNASSTLQDQLTQLTQPTSNSAEMLLSYNRANRAVAILCNHQRTVPKTFDKTMENLNEKKQKKQAEVKACKAELKKLKMEKASEQKIATKRNQLKRLKEQRKKIEISVTDKNENKQIALGTSKLNYLDPRISVAWCKKYSVPIEKIYNKTQRDKFQWAIDMTDEHFKF